MTKRLVTVIMLCGLAAWGQYNPGPPTNSGATPGPNVSAYLTQSTVHGGMVAGTYTNLQFTAAGSNKIASLGGATPTNGLSGVTFLEATTNSARITTNWMTITFKTNYSASGGVTNNQWLPDVYGVGVTASNALTGDSFSNQFTGVVATNVGGNARVVLVDGVTSQLSIYAGGYRASVPSQGTVGGRILMYSTNGSSPGSIAISTPSATGSVSIVSVERMSISSAQGVTFNGAILTNVGTIYLTNGLTTAGSETAAIPIYGAAINNKVTINSGFSNVINELDNFVDLRTASNYVLRLYSLQTNLMAAREILDLWNYDAGTNVLFASGFGIQSGWGAHLPTQAVYQFAIATTARGTNNLSHDAQFKVSSPSVNGLLTAMTIKSEGDVVVTGRVTAASFAGDGSALTGVSGGSGSGFPATNMMNAAGYSLTNLPAIRFTNAAAAAWDNGGTNLAFTFITSSGTTTTIRFGLFQ